MATLTLPTPLERMRSAASARLAALAPREQRLVRVAALVVVIGLLWWFFIQPAWQTLRQAPGRHAELDNQLAQMQRMAQTADNLRSQSSGQPPARDEALRALETATQALGAAGQVTVLADRATLTLRGVAPQDLAQWLQQVRVNARLLPVESQLNRDGGAGGWSGSVVVAGPTLGGG